MPFPLDLYNFYEEESRKPIDPELNKLFFPVEERPVYWEKDERQKSKTPSRPEFTQRYFAIVDKERNSLFTIVSRLYFLVTNKDAYFISRAIARYMFRKHDANINFEFVPFSKWINKNRSVCQISICRKIDYNQPELNDGWCAGISMHNSYNKTVALTYYIGFFKRKGLFDQFSHLSLLLPENSISFKLKKVKYDDLIFQVNRQLRKFEESRNILDIEEAFLKKLEDLKKAKMNGNMFLAFFCKFFHIIRKNIEESGTITETLEVRDFINIRKEFYIREYGQNAYAFLLAISDYISNYKNIRVINNYISYQVQAGQWVDDYLKVAADPDFSLYKYIGEEAFNTASWLDSL